MPSAPNIIASPLRRIDSARRTAHAESVTTRTGTMVAKSKRVIIVTPPRPAPRPAAPGSATAGAGAPTPAFIDRLPTTCSMVLRTAGSIGFRNKPGSTPIRIAAAQIGTMTAHSRMLRSRSPRFLSFVSGP